MILLIDAKLGTWLWRRTLDSKELVHFCLFSKIVYFLLFVVVVVDDMRPSTTKDIGYPHPKK